MNHPKLVVSHKKWILWVSSSGKTQLVGSFLLHSVPDLSYRPKHKTPGSVSDNGTSVFGRLLQSQAWCLCWNDMKISSSKTVEGNTYTLPCDWGFSKHAKWILIQSIPRGNMWKVRVPIDWGWSSKGSSDLALENMWCHFLPILLITSELERPY